MKTSIDDYITQTGVYLTKDRGYSVDGKFKHSTGILTIRDLAEDGNDPVDIKKPNPNILETLEKEKAIRKRGSAIRANVEKVEGYDVQAVYIKNIGNIWRWLGYRRLTEYANGEERLLEGSHNRLKPLAETTVGTQDDIFEDGSRTFVLYEAKGHYMITEEYHYSGVSGPSPISVWIATEDKEFWENWEETQTMGTEHYPARDF